jgi:hypothetical protein
MGKQLVNFITSLHPKTSFTEIVPSLFDTCLVDPREVARCVGEVEDMPTRAATDERKKVVEQDIITEIL